MELAFIFAIEGQKCESEKNVVEREGQKSQAGGLTIYTWRIQQSIMQE